MRRLEGVEHIILPLYKIEKELCSMMETNVRRYVLDINLKSFNTFNEATIGQIVRLSAFCKFSRIRLYGRPS